MSELTATYGPYMFRIMNTDREDLVPYVHELCRCVKVKEYKIVSKSFIFIIFDEPFTDNQEVINLKDKFPSLKSFNLPDFIGHENQWVKWSDENDKKYKTDYLREYCTGDWINGSTGAVTYTTITSSTENSIEA